MVSQAIQHDDAPHPFGPLMPQDGKMGTLRGRASDLTRTATALGEASIVALAASHHRLAWVHPFLDGNGRVMRLHTHLLLRASGLTNGLWSPLRGFARTEVQYKSLLQAADEHRRATWTAVAT